MSSAPVLVIAHPREVALWENALRDRGLEVVRADRKGARKAADQRTPAVVVVSEKLPFMGALRVTRELRGDPATKEVPVVLVGVRPFTVAQRLRLGAAAPDATVDKGASPEAIADAVVEARKTGKLAPPELTPAQRAGQRYQRLGTMLMFMGVIFSMPTAKPAGGDERSWFILLIPLGGLVSDIATGRVDGRRKLLTWQGWAAIGFTAAIALGILYLPRYFRLL